MTILVLPGLYLEEPSLLPEPDVCHHLAAKRVPFGYQILSYEQQKMCPHQQNLVGIFGIKDLQIEGTGAAVTVATASSAIGIRDARGDVKVKTQSGAVTIDLAPTADVEVETGSSAIDVSGGRRSTARFRCTDRTSVCSSSPRSSA